MSVENWVTKLQNYIYKSVEMLVHFKIFVSVMCIVYQGAEGFKKLSEDDKKLDLNFKEPNSEDRGSRTSRSLLHMNSEDAYDDAQLVADYFDKDGPSTISTYKEPTEFCKCNQCSGNKCKCCNSGTSRSSPEPKDTIVGASMENSWCPTDLLGISHHAQPSQINFGNNEIVGKARESVPDDRCLIHEPVLKERKIYKNFKFNVEESVPKTYYIPQPRTIHTYQDLLINPVVNNQPKQIELPAHEVFVPGPTVELSPQPQSRTFNIKPFSLTQPLISFQTPQCGITSNVPTLSLNVPKLNPGFLPYSLTPSVPLLQLFGSRLFPKFTSAPPSLSTVDLNSQIRTPALQVVSGPAPSQFNVASPRFSVTPSQFNMAPRQLNMVPIDFAASHQPLINLETTQFKVAAPRTELSLPTVDLSSQINVPASQLNLDVAPVDLNPPKMRTFGQLGLKPLKLHFGLPSLFSHPVGTTTPQLANYVTTQPYYIQVPAPSANVIIPPRKILCREKHPAVFQESEEPTARQVIIEHVEPVIEQIAEKC